jgi:hypothetical protein
MEVDYSLNARIQRDCFRILTLGKPKSYGRTIKLECTRFEFINEFLPGVYAEMDVPDPFTGKKYRRIVPRKLVRELSGLPPKPKYEPIEEQTKVNSILEKIEIRMQRETQALANQLQEIEVKETALQLFPKKGAWNRTLSNEERFDRWLYWRVNGF